MIARIWHGWTKPGDAKAYEDMLRDEIFPSIAARNIKGYRGAELFINQDADEAEFVTLLRFDSMDAIKDFAVHANMFERNVTAAAGAGGMHAQAANHDKSDDQHGAGQEEDLDLFRHQTDLFYSLLRRKNACKGELLIIIATFPWMRLIFPEKRENLKSRAPPGHLVPY